MTPMTPIFKVFHEGGGLDLRHRRHLWINSESGRSGYLNMSTTRRKLWLGRSIEPFRMNFSSGEKNGISPIVMRRPVCVPLKIGLIPFSSPLQLVPPCRGTHVGFRP